MFKKIPNYLFIFIYLFSINLSASNSNNDDGPFISVGNSSYSLSQLKSILPDEKFWNGGLDKIFHGISVKQAHNDDKSHVPEFGTYVDEGYELTKTALKNNPSEIRKSDETDRTELLEQFKAQVDGKRDAGKLSLFDVRVFMHQCSILISDTFLPRNKYWATGECLPFYDSGMFGQNEADDFEKCKKSVFFAQSVGMTPVPNHIWMFSYVSDSPELGLFPLVLAYACNLAPEPVPTSNDGSPHQDTYSSWDFVRHDGNHASRLDLREFDKPIFHSSNILYALLERKNELEPQDIMRTVVGLFYNFHEERLRCTGVNPEENHLYSGSLLFYIQAVDEDSYHEARNEQALKFGEPTVPSKSFAEDVQNDALSDKGEFHFLKACGYPMTHNPYDPNAPHETYLGFLQERVRYFNELSDWFAETWKDYLPQEQPHSP